MEASIMSNRSSLIGQICQYRLESYGRYVPTDYPKDANLNDYNFQDLDPNQPLSHEFLASSYLQPSDRPFNISPRLQRGPKYLASKPELAIDEIEEASLFQSLGILARQNWQGKPLPNAYQVNPDKATYLYPESGVSNYKYLDQEPWKPNMFFTTFPLTGASNLIGYMPPAYGIADDDVEKYTVVPLKEKTLVNRLKLTGQILTRTTYLYCSLTRPSDEHTNKLPTFAWLRPEWLVPGRLEVSYKDEFKFRLRDTIKKIIKG